MIKKVWCVYIYIYLQWKTTQSLKRRKFCHSWQHGWTLRALIMLSEISQIKKNTAWSHLYVESKTTTTTKNQTHIRHQIWASLVAPWLGVCLPMQGTRVRALVWEDHACCGATGPVSHNYWACAPQQERLWRWETRAPRWRVAPTRHNWRKPMHRDEDPTQPKINK